MFGGSAVAHKHTQNTSNPHCTAAVGSTPATGHDAELCRPQHIRPKQYLRPNVNRRCSASPSQEMILGGFRDGVASLPLCTCPCSLRTVSKMDFGRRVDGHTAHNNTSIVWYVQTSTASPHPHPPHQPAHMPPTPGGGGGGVQYTSVSGFTALGRPASGVSCSPESNTGKPPTPCKVSCGGRGALQRFRTPSILPVDTIPSHFPPPPISRCRAETGAAPVRNGERRILWVRVEWPIPRSQQGGP